MRTLFGLLLLMLALPASAADITISLSAEETAEAQALCNQLRTELRAKEWNYQICAKYFLRIGLRQYKAQKAENDVRDLARAAFRQTLQEFDGTFPQPFVQARCGDGSVDAFLNEQCDDGNNEDGDGCSADCQSE